MGSDLHCESLPALIILSHHPANALQLREADAAAAGGAAAFGVAPAAADDGLAAGGLLGDGQQLCGSSTGGMGPAGSRPTWAEPLSEPHPVRLCCCYSLWLLDAHLVSHKGPTAFPLPGFDMGAVVPVSEPEWSGAHHGLCLYASRVLQAVWDEQVRVAGAGLQVLEYQCTLGS